MKKYNDVSIVMQGPICESTIFAIAKYKNLAEIILTNMCPDDTPQFTRFKKIGDIKIITYKSHEVSDCANRIRTCNKNNLHSCYQFYSTKLGIDHSEKSYIIKTRSDEYYENMDYFIDKVRKNPDCVFTNNVFFRKNNFKRCHPSDHLLGATKIVFSRAMEILFEMINSGVLTKYAITNWQHNCNVPEQFFGVSLFHTLHEFYGIGQDDWNWKAFVRKIRVEKLGNYKITNNEAKRIFINNYNINIRSDDASVDPIEEYEFKQKYKFI